MSLSQDVRFAARLLLKDRWFTLAAATALALGIGVNAAVFTFVNAVLLRGLPFEDPGRIIAFETIDQRGRDLAVAYSDFKDWREQTRTVTGLSAYLSSTINVSDEGKPPEQFRGSYVSGDLFQVVGVHVAMGRDFSADNDQPGAEPVAIIGYGLWQKRYGGDAAILGRTIKVNSLLVTIIGVMPQGMQFPNNDDVWVPLSKLPADSLDPRRDVRNFNVLGRLSTGASLQQARAEFDAIGKRLADAYPATNKDIRPRLMTYNERVNGGPIQIVFLSLMGAVAFVLLIACANVANLLLARSAHRAKEISVRVALGATRWRIVRQLLIESLLLATISGAIGFVLSLAIIRWFDIATHVGKPYWMTFTMDGVVFAFIAAICLGTAIVFGLAPAMHVSKTDANEVLKEGGRGGTSGIRARRWTSALIVTELVLTLVLLAGAGYMIRSFVTLYTMDTGIDTSRLLTMQLYLPLTKYPQPGPRTAVYQQFEERLKAIPSIQASTLTSNLPLGGGYARSLAIDGRPVTPGQTLPVVTLLTVGDTYFEALNIRLLRGRTLNGGDGAPGHEAAVVNQRFAAQHFGTEDPIGRRIKLTLQPPQPPGPDPAWVTIVGVSPDIRQRGVRDRETDPVAYLPYRADPQRSASLLVRTMADPASVTASVREALRVVEPDLPLFRIQTMDEWLTRERWEFQVFGTMFAGFAAIALALSAVGLYAVTAYSVTQRTQEIGIRVALGAQPRGVMWLVLRRSLVQLAIGLPIGIAGAFGVGTVLKSLLVQTGPNDPVTLFSIVMVLVAVAILACLWPARRAARLDPMVALRD